MNRCSLSTSCSPNGSLWPLSVLACATSLLLISCSTPNKEREYPVKTADRAVVSFGCFAFFGSDYHYLADGHRAYRKLSFQVPNKSGPKPVWQDKQEEIVPSPAAWHHFWAEIDLLQVPEWKLRYRPEDVSYGLGIDDGLLWHMTYQTPSSKKHETSGDNTYPEAGAPQIATLNPQTFNELKAAFDCLFPTSASSFVKP